VVVGAGSALIGGLQATEPGADSPVTLTYPMLGVGLALLVPGVLVGVWGRSHRVITPKGEAALANVTAFRSFIVSATPPPRDDDPAGAGGEGALDRYVPYAIVFGVTNRWAGLMDARGMATVGWFAGSGDGSFGEDIDSFTTTTSGAVFSTADLLARTFH
jgi:hypothetical protein